RLEQNILGNWDPRGRHPPERRLLILGGPQSGKTSTANSILGDEVFDIGTETTHSNVGQTEIYGRRVTVVDTPPWAIPSDPEDIPERIRQESQRGAALLRPGPHTLLA
uniref:AIG1-type G domain-containing protein n=1 Tax=Cyclopterus lumpus TaxID=8103 RepID=A0A8C2ZC90_CYCLU